MIPGEKLQIFASQRTLSIAGHCQSFRCQTRKRIGQDSCRPQTIGPMRKFFDGERVVIEHSQHEFIERPVIVLLANLGYQPCCNLRPERIEFKQTIPALMQLGRNFFLRLFRLFNQAGQLTLVLQAVSEFTHKLVHARAKAYQQLLPANEVLRKRVQPFVVPASKHFLARSQHKGNVNLNLCPLSNSIQSADPLFEHFRIEWKIKQDQMVSKLKIPALTADLRTKKDSGSVLLSKPCCVPIPLEQRKTFMKHAGLQILDTCSKRRLDGCYLGLSAADQQHLFRLQLPQQTGEPVDSFVFR